MNVFNTQTGSIEVPNKWSFNIYFSGCKNNKKCDRHLCHNKELMDFSYGVHYLSIVDDIIDKLKVSQGLVECICLLGGEPFDQDLKCLQDFIRLINIFNLPVYAYTGYDDMSIIEDFMKHLNLTDVFYGPYLQEQKNQKWYSEV